MRASEHSDGVERQDLRASRRKASHDCEICRLQRGFAAHWAWHDYCRAELNPLALVQWIEHSFPTMGGPIVQHIVAVTGMDYDAAKQALSDEAGSSPRVPLTDEG